MKELLYIPSGRYVRFYDIPGELSAYPTLSIEEYSIRYTKYYRRQVYLNIIIDNFRNGYFHMPIYEFAEVPYPGIDNPIPLNYFELVDD